MPGGPDDEPGHAHAHRVTPQGVAVRRAFGAAGRAAAAYTRFELDPLPELPSPPYLVVINHGFGTFLDLNALLAAHVGGQLGLGPDVPIVILAHQLAWQLRIGPLLEPAGFRPAGRDVALDALRRRLPVLVLPGGDLDASKTWRHRNEVHFHGRSGFARLAQEAGVPILPMVITGAGDTLVNFTAGRRLARAVGLERLTRQKSLPLSFALPWGLNLGLALYAYLPWPAKMRGRILEPVRIGDDEDPAEAAARVEGAMNDAARQLTAGRRPHLDWLRPPPARRSD
jgi:1-acyl-sn-glycerol-3-phosphate acyltransferase